MSSKIRCLVVDESATLRSLLQRMLNSDPEIDVVATAPDPYAAREKLLEWTPDVMLLNIEMSQMDGLAFLEKVMAARPTRTLILSPQTKKEAELALRALEAGAIDVLMRPPLDAALPGMRQEIVHRIKAVARARFQKPREPQHEPLISTDAGFNSNRILVMAASTGGTEALKVVLSALGPNIPGTLIVQHLPPVYTRTFATGLNRLCPFTVKEAEDGDRVQPGLVLIAPGDYHMEVLRRGSHLHVKMNQDAPQHSVRPAADVLMRTVAKYVGKDAIGVVLTGMGRDGALGLLEMHRAGAYTIAQDEASSVVYGMPRAAVEAGGVDRILALSDIAPHIMQELQKREGFAG
jgi:two-component system chemotaxis response regulator CheB